MTAREFQRYLERPTALYDLPLATLQAVARQHPYSPNLRLLLLLKTHLEGHPEEADYLTRCAAAAFDRAFVYDLLREIDRPAGTEATEVLELKTLDDLALEEAALPAESAPPASERTYDDRFLPPVGAPDEPEPDPEPNPQPVLADAPPGGALIVSAPPPPSPPLPELERWVASAAAFLDSLPPPAPPLLADAEPAYPLTHSPEPVTRFEPATAVAGPVSLRERLRSIRDRQFSKLADEEEDSVRRIARRSLVSSEGTASETLARLLVQQGQYQNAIKMYRRLELLYPEKKTIFAGLISDLQKKL